MTLNLFLLRLNIFSRLSLQVDPKGKKGRAERMAAKGKGPAYGKGPKGTSREFYVPDHQSACQKVRLTNNTARWRSPYKQRCSLALALKHF